VFACLLPFSEYYYDCAIGGQHDGRLPLWLPAFEKFIFCIVVFCLLMAK